MYIEIHHNTNEPLNEQDKALLRALLGEKVQAVAASEEPVKPAPLKKTPWPEEPQETEKRAEEQAADDAEAADEPTLEDAQALARKFVAAGEAAKVKKALTKVGAKKVSEIPEDKIADFMADLG